MTHILSHTTTYLETFIIHPVTGEHTLRSHASAFFIEYKNELFLVTNWHVVTGIDPEKPQYNDVNNPSPHYIKIVVINKKSIVVEITLPLYDADMNPLWEEHLKGSNVDIIAYPLPNEYKDLFFCININNAANNLNIREEIAKNTFIIGYPFSKKDLHDLGSSDSAYFLPIWKGGTIATEPKNLLGNGVILIDTLSRPGMSGSPVVIAQDEKRINLGTIKNSNLYKEWKEGIISSEEYSKNLDKSSTYEENVKEFLFLGIYSGVIGNTRLNQVALGKCWHKNLLIEIINNSHKGKMPYHQPIKNEHYDLFFKQFNGSITTKNKNGETKQILLINND